MSDDYVVTVGPPPHMTGSAKGTATFKKHGRGDFTIVDNDEIDRPARQQPW